jgi:site-specific recombinase XerD
MVSAGTTGSRVKVGQRFLDHVYGDEIDEIDRVTGKEIIDFLLRESQTTRAGSVGNTASALRSFLRYLYLEGTIATDLTSSVPAQASWRQTGLPKALSESEARRLLQSCDRRTRTGRRDYAAIVMMLRLGLRVGEVGALELEDIDWRCGELVIHGKGGQTERMPLPDDVGQALSSYLKCRQRISARRVFLRVWAPHGPLSVGGLQNIVREAGKRAGLGPIGPHRLRHTAATAMLRGGASLAHVSHVLRHRHLDTTAIYAKVDRESLRQLAQPWPGDEA